MALFSRPSQTKVRTRFVPVYEITKRDREFDCFVAIDRIESDPSSSSFATMIAMLSASKPDSSNFKSSDNGTSVRCCSRATSNIVVTVDLTGIRWTPLLVLPSLCSSSRRYIRDCALFGNGGASSERLPHC